MSNSLKKYSMFMLCVALLGMVLYSYPMENNVERVPSLRTLCLDYVCTHANQVDLLGNLSKLPVDLAREPKLYGSVHYLNQHRHALTSLIHKGELDHSVLSTIARVLCTHKKSWNSLWVSIIKQTVSIIRMSDFDLVRTIDCIINIKNICVPLALDDKQGRLEETFNSLVTVLNKINICYAEKKEHIYNTREASEVDAALLQLKVDAVLLKELSYSTDELIKHITQDCLATICPQIISHAIAKKGTICADLVKEIITGFIGAGITDNFDALFNRCFSEDILKHGNEAFLYREFSYAPLLAWLMKENISLFPIEEFGKNLYPTMELKGDSCVKITCAEKNYKANIHIDCLKGLSLIAAIINPEHNLLVIRFKHLHNEESKVALINIKTWTSTIILQGQESEIKQMGLNSDCSQLGIMLSDNSIISYGLPTELITFAPSFKQKAFMYYINAKITSLQGQINELQAGKNVVNNVGDTIKLLAVMPIDQIMQLIECIQNNKNLIPEPVYNALYNHHNESQIAILNLGKFYTIVADQLNIDLKTLADKVSSHEITEEQMVAIVESNDPELARIINL